MSGPERRYWFPAKRYGWGWGPPTAWQGWVVLIAWLATVALVAIRLAPGNPLLFAVFLVVMVAVLMLICYAKGETPRWRRGGGNRAMKP